MCVSQKTIAQQLNVKEFPFIITDDNGNKIYYEESSRFWYKQEFNENGNQIYYEDFEGFWYKREFDENGNVIYYKNSHETWVKHEYDSNGNEIYYENSDGVIMDKRSGQPSYYY